MCETESQVINCIITYDSKHVVCISTNEQNLKCQIQEYSLLTNQQKFCLSVEGKYIVMDQIEQNIPEGSIMCVPYNDNGALRTLVFDNTGDIIDTLNINEICDIDEGSKPIFGFQNPLITACFNQKDDIYFQAFHRV